MDDQREAHLDDVATDDFGDLLEEPLPMDHVNPDDEIRDLHDAEGA